LISRQKLNPAKTIAAIATPPGVGGVGVIRVSGPLVPDIAKSITKKTLKPRFVEYVCFFNAHDCCIDKGIAILFLSPKSFTGEDVLELHGHGGHFVLNELLLQVLSLGAHMAAPGEFLLRAFLNNKLDLIQAEAIDHLINAHSSRAARASMHSLNGVFSKKINCIIDRVISLRTHMESAIDFSEEGIELVHKVNLINTIKNISKEIDDLIQLTKQGERLLSGTNIVITGKTNAGKSSLFNLFAKNDLSIVTDIPGTTRDIVKAQVSIGGFPFNILDTAGLNYKDSVIEKEGVRRALLQLSKADLILFVVDIFEEDSFDPYLLFPTLNKHISSLSRFIVVANKIDKTSYHAHVNKCSTHKTVFLSVKTGEGVGLLELELQREAGLLDQQESVFSARQRHVKALELAKKHIDMPIFALMHDYNLELCAEELRIMHNVLATITGDFLTEDLLGEIFSKFCIGK